MRFTEGHCSCITTPISMPITNLAATKAGQAYFLPCVMMIPCASSPEPSVDPSSRTSSSSFLITKDLIKKGAKLCEGAEHILSEFEYLFPASNRLPSAGQTGVLPAL